MTSRATDGLTGVATAGGADIPVTYDRPADASAESFPGSGDERDVAVLESGAVVGTDPPVKSLPDCSTPHSPLSLLGGDSHGPRSRASREMFVVWMHADQAYRGRVLWAEDELAQARSWPDRRSAQEFADTLGTGAAEVVRVRVGRSRNR